MRFDLVWQRQLPLKGRQAGRQQLFFRATVAILRVGGSPPIGLIEFPVELQLQFRLRLSSVAGSGTSATAVEGGSRSQSGCQLISFGNLLCPILLAEHFHLYFLLSSFLLPFSLIFFGKERIMWWSIRHVGRCDYLWLCFEIKRKPKIPQGSPADSANVLRTRFHLSHVNLT